MLLVVLICLPLQGLAVVTMPACHAHGPGMGMHVDADQAVGAMAHCDEHEPDQPPANTPCDKCFHCFLGAAQAIMPAAITLAVSGNASVTAGLIAEIHESFFSSPFRPPR